MPSRTKKEAGLFDKNMRYGLMGVGDAAFFELDARRFLPKGTPFKIIEHSARMGYKRFTETGWYYSPDGGVPNPKRVRVVRECVA